MYNTVVQTPAAVNSKAGSPFAKDPASKGKSQSTIAVIIIAVLCTVLPLDIAELIFLILAAFIYVMLRKSGSEGKNKSQPMSPPAHHKSSVEDSRVAGQQMRIAPRGATQKKLHSVGPQNASKSTAAPIAAPTFRSTHWDGEVVELLNQITPTQENEDIVSQLARIMKRHICGLLPQAEVEGYVSGNFASGKAFGVAVPEVDIVVSVNPAALVARMQGRIGAGNASSEVLDSRKLHKWAIRTCTDRLVATGDFKFRRSAFRQDEPKVTLLAPSSLGLFSQSIPLDFSINSVTPLYNAALLTECGQIEPRAKELILLVKRWSKDRGICHAPKGHLSPYVWGILAVYFLQVDVQLLPGLQHFQLSSKLMGGRKGTDAKYLPTLETPGINGAKWSTAALFKEFIKFYTSKFDWRNEAVAVRLGFRAAPSSQLPLHIIIQNAGSATLVGPSIEDPFEAKRNLGTCVTADSFTRLKEELQRADQLCDHGESLTKLLEPWVPTDSEGKE